MGAGLKLYLFCPFVVSLEYMDASDVVCINMRLYEKVLERENVTRLMDIFDSIKCKNVEGYYKR